MKLAEALALVIELAEGNIIDDPDLKDEAKRQRKAIRRVSKLLPALTDD